MKHKQNKTYCAALGFILWVGTVVAAAPESELLELRDKNKQLVEQLERQSAEIAALKKELQQRNETIANPQSIPSHTNNTPALAIQKSFEDIAISLEEGKMFQATYIQLFSTRINEVESLNLEFVFKKHGSKVVHEDHFDPFSADRVTQKYKTEIRHETEDPRCLATCKLIKRILEERYGLAEVPIIHDSQYTYKGNRRYVEVYICEDLAGQTFEFKDQKLPLRFW
ncbi:MAG: hypothetical protein KAU94_10585 [Verrucomicrobia bacterium]|nr:hypothetical protein [Verrucomicrobiota bacterium]